MMKGEVRRREIAGSQGGLRVGHTDNDVAQKAAYCVNRIAKMWLFYNTYKGMRSRFW